MERQRILRARFDFAEVVLFDANRVVHLHVVARIGLVAVYNAWGVALLLELNHIRLEHLTLHAHPLVARARAAVEWPRLREVQLAHVVRCLARVEGHADVAEQTQTDQTRRYFGHIKCVTIVVTTLRAGCAVALFRAGGWTLPGIFLMSGSGNLNPECLRYTAS